MADGIEFPVIVPINSTGGDTVAAQLNEIASAGAAAESAVAKLNDATDEANGAIGSVGAASSEAASGANELSGGLGNLDATTKRALGPLGEKVDRLGALQSVLGSTGMAAAGAAAIWAAAAYALIQLGAAAISATYQLAKFALQSNKAAWDRMTKATAKLEDNFAKLMARVRVDKFVSAWEDVLSIFDEGSSTAKAMSTLFSTILDPLFEAAAIVAPYVKEALKGIAWAALQVAIVAVKVGKALWEMVPDSVKDAITELSASIDWMKVGFWAGAVVAGILAAAIGILAVIVVAGAVVAFGLLFVAMVALLAIPILIVAAIALVVAALVWLGAQIYDGISALIDLGAAGLEAAGNLIDGLVNGIRSGAGAVYDALRNMASQMSATIKSALGIASPSKLFAEFGGYTAEGFAVGIEDETPTVTSALEGMTSDAGAPELGQSGSSGSSSAPITLRFVGPNGQSQTRRVRAGETLTLALEDIALALGAGEVPA